MSSGHTLGCLVAVSVENIDYIQVPLMRNPEGTRDTCVQCGREFDCLAENGTELAVEEEEHQDETENSVPAIEKHVADAPSDVSSILADRMLRGWTLLADHCPRCVEFTFCAGFVQVESPCDACVV